MTAVVTLLASHRFFSWLRLRPRVPRWVLERPPVVLVCAGEVVPGALRRVHLSEGDLNTVLRQHGVRRLGDVDLVVLEPRGAFSVIRVGHDALEPRLVEDVEGSTQVDPRR